MRGWQVTLGIAFSSAFKRDMKHIAARDLEAVRNTIGRLQYGFDLPPSARPHPLQGKYIGWMDCHAANDIVLIYRVEGDCLRLNRVGSHARLFG